MTLKNKIAFVTGGNNGNLGPVWVKALEGEGVNVVVLDLPEYDVSDAGSIADFRSNHLIGHVPDIIVNNAAIDSPPGSDASFFGDFDRILRVNLGGTVRVVSEFIGDMVDRRRGNIVNVGSMLGFTASNPTLYPENFDKPCAYGASKAGIWNFTNNCNTRFARHGVISNMIALSAVEGLQSEEFKKKYREKIPIGRMLKPEDFINEFLCCCSAKVPYDAPLFVGGGYTIW